MDHGCPSLAARKWLGARPEASTLLLGVPAIEARSAGAGRGLGLFTTRLIPAFAEILHEAPTVLLGPTDDLPQLYERFLALRKPGSDALLQKYLALAYHEVPERDARLRQKLIERGFTADSVGEMIKVASIMQTNAFNVDIGDGQGRTHRGLFADVARLNHACAPNAHVCFYQLKPPQDPGRMVIHALRDLQPGEEVLIAYFNILLPRSERQTKALAWGFQCQCIACEAHDGDIHEQRRKAISDFTAKQTALMTNHRATMKQIHHLLATGRSIVEKIFHDGAFRPVLPDLCDHLAMLRAKAVLLRGKESHRDDIVEFLEQAVIWEARITGSESPATHKRLQKLGQFAARTDAAATSPRIATNEVHEFRVEWEAG